MSSINSDYSILAALAAAIIPAIFALILNIVFGAIAVSMAKKRGLRPVPAFFAGFFGSFIALIFIAMFPTDSVNTTVKY